MYSAIWACLGHRASNVNIAVHPLFSVYNFFHICNGFWLSVFQYHIAMVPRRFSVFQFNGRILYIYVPLCTGLILSGGSAVSST